MHYVASPGTGPCLLLQHKWVLTLLPSLLVFVFLRLVGRLRQAPGSAHPVAANKENTLMPWQDIGIGVVQSRFVHVHAMFMHRGEV